MLEDSLVQILVHCPRDHIPDPAVVMQWTLSIVILDVGFSRM